MVTIGIDTHKATLAASAIDPTGRELGARTFPNDPHGHARLRRWAEGHGSDRRFGIEGSGSYGAPLARLLVTAGEPVVGCPQSSPIVSAGTCIGRARAIPVTPSRLPG